MRGNLHLFTIKRVLALILALLLAVQIIPPFAMQAQAASDYVIVITGGTVNVRSGAGGEMSKVGSTSLGKIYDYLGEGKDNDGTTWFKIQYSSSKVGWVTGKYSIKTTRGSDCTQAVINRIASAHGAVGVQVAVIENGTVTDTYNYGWATKNNARMDSDTKIRVASLSKVAVAVCAMKMQEQGIVDITKNIGTYWKCTPYKVVTLKSMLSHTSTLKSTLGNTTKAGTVSQLTSSNSYTSGTVGSSSSFVYNNYAVGVAGATLEMASGKTLNNYAKVNIFQPLGMDTSFSAGLISNTSKLATLYHSTGKVARSISAQKELKGSTTPGGNASQFAGGLTCSANDYAKLIAMLANDGTYNGVKILSPSSVKTIETTLFSKSEYGASFQQCMPLRYKKGIYGQSGLYYHTGNAYGVLAMASYDPVTKNGVVVLTTGMSDASTTPACGRDAQGIYEICGWISEYIYRHGMGGGTVFAPTTTRTTTTTTATTITTTTTIAIITTTSAAPTTTVTTTAKEPVTTTASIITGAPTITTTASTTTTTAASESGGSAVGSVRLSGSDRLQTAFAICDEGWDSSECVYIANGYAYADALAAVPLAGLDNAPILLTANKSGGLESGISLRLQALGVKRVYILGGTSVVSSSIEQQLKRAGYAVERIYGRDRYATSLAIARRVDAKNSSNEVFCVSGVNFPDALSASSAAGMSGAPIIYVPATGKAGSAALEYVSSSGKTTGYIIGGEKAVGKSVFNSINSVSDLTARRIYGSDRYATSLAVFKYFSGLYGKVTAVSVATGENYPDALTGGAFAASRDIPLLLVSNKRNMSDLSDYIDSRYDINSVYVFGGKTAVSDDALKKLFT